MAAFQTEGERLFAEYLEQELGLREGSEWHYEMPVPGRVKMLDFAVTTRTPPVLIESKDFAAPTPEEVDAEVASGGGMIDPYRGIRRKIDQVRRQLRPFAAEFPCGVVIRSGVLPEQTFALSNPREVFAAMLGDLGVEIPSRPDGSLVTEGARRVFLGGGKMFAPHTRRPRNTSVGAVLVLSQVDAHRNTMALVEARRRDLYAGAGPSLRATEAVSEAVTEAGIPQGMNHLAVRVHVNPFTRAPDRVPFDAAPFCGPCDEVWVYDLEGESIEQTFVGNLIGRARAVAASIAESLGPVLERELAARDRPPATR